MSRATEHRDARARDPLPEAAADPESCRYGVWQRFEAVFSPAGMSRRERRRRAFYALCVMILVPALSVFAVLDWIAGRWEEAISNTLFIASVASTLLFLRHPNGFAWVVRLCAFLTLAMTARETALGLNDGLTFVWFYVIPMGIFFLLGEKEGAAWTITTCVLSAMMLTGVLGTHRYSREVAMIFMITFGLACSLGFVLESSKRMLADRLRRDSTELRQALSQVKTLRTLMPICAECKSIRDDDGYWHEIGGYLDSHPATELEHALCPDCTSQQLPLQQLRPCPSRTAEPPDSPFQRWLSTPTDSGDRQRRLTFAVSLGLVAPIVGLLGWRDGQQGRLLESFLVSSTAALLLVLAVAAVRARDAKPIFRLAVIAVIPVMAFELAIGAAEGSAFLWLYLMPPLVMVLFGQREGAFWLAITLLVTTPFLITPLGPDYPPGVAWRFLVAWGVVSLFGYATETSRQSYEERLLEEKSALEAALANVQTLKGLLPLCPSCKKVRHDEGYWERIDDYISRHTDVRFSHGLCPQCAETMMAEVGST